MSNTPVNASSTATGSANLLGGGVSPNGDLTSLFTTLLVAQIKNQDPLQPNDPSQFVSQLAQLSQVQSMQQLVTQGKSGNSALNSLQMMALGAQVGSTVRAGVSQLQLSDQPVTLHVNLDAKSASNELVLTSPYGGTQTISLGSLAAGDQAFTVDPKALGLPAGSYSVAVLNVDKQSLPVEAETALTGVRLASDGSVFARLAGVGEVPSSAITQLEGRPATSQTASN
ncbi:MAG: flagellar basal body rod modification protein [Paucibacter sp.]|nr:flagellar basal body rod modification protein [Roseateles sp.]